MGAGSSSHNEKHHDNERPNHNHEDAVEVGPPFVDEKYFDVLNRSWFDIKEFGPELIGVDTFNGLFQNFPETKSMFESFCDDPNYQTNPKYLHHCKIVVNIMGSFILILKKPKLLKSHLDYLGFQHNIRDVNQRHFDLLGEQFILALEKNLAKDKWSSLHKEAWSTFYNAMVVVMISSYVLNK